MPRIAETKKEVEGISHPNVKACNDSLAHSEAL